MKSFELFSDAGSDLLTEASMNQDYSFNGNLEPLYKNPGAFDSDFYLRRYSDVAEAVSKGIFETAYQHWVLHGQSEGRLPSAEISKTKEDELTGMAESEIEASQALQESWQLVHNLLKNFANSPDCNAKMKVAFGENFDVEKANVLTQSWVLGDFNTLPPVEVRSGKEINGAASAYAGMTNKIYLSGEFLSLNVGNIEVVAGVLLEEIGHSVDKQLNAVDTPGDEGAIFSTMVRGETLTSDSLQHFKSEDDTATVSLDGQILEIEQATLGPISGGFEGSTQTIKLGSKGGGTAQYSYEFYEIPDRFIFRYEGKTILDTGFVSGRSSGIVNIPIGNSDQLEVILATNNIDTLWEYTINTEPLSGSLSDGSSPTGTTVATSTGTTVNIPKKHELYEFFAKDVAYKNLIGKEGQDLSNVYEPQRFKDLVNGYKVDKVFDDPKTGFFAVGLTSNQGKEPVLAFRGTEPTANLFADVFSDSDPRGVGFNQYEANRVVNNADDNVRITPLEWLTQVSGDRNKNPNLLAPDITGHSLGGALSQLFATDFTKDGKKLGEIVTFNSPGIPNSKVDEFKVNAFNTPQLADVTHYIVSGDLVSLGGQAFLPGKYNLIDFFDFNLLNNHLLPVLTQEVNYDQPTYDKPSADGKQKNSTKPGDVTITNCASAEWLSNPLFTYAEPEFLSWLSAGLVITNTEPLLTPLTPIVPLLLFRGTTETLRKAVGTGVSLVGSDNIAQGITKISEAINERNLASVSSPSVELPQQDFNLLNLIDIKPINSVMKYVKTGEPLKIQGEVSLPQLFNLKANFTGENFIQIDKCGIDVKGELYVPELPIVPNLLTLKETRLSLDTTQKEVAGKGVFYFPLTKKGIVAGVGLKDKKLNSATFGVDGLKIPLGTTNLALQKVEGTIGNMAAIEKLDIGELAKLDFGLSTNITDVFPEVPFRLPFNLPGWFADTNFLGQMVDIDAGFKVNKDSFQLDGDLKFISDKIKDKAVLEAKGSLQLNWADKTLKSIRNLEVSVLGNFIKGKLQFQTDPNMNFHLLGQGNINSPNILLDAPLVGKINIGSVPLAEGQFRIDFSNNKDFSDDVIQAYAKIKNIPLIGEAGASIKVFLAPPKDGSPQVQATIGNALPKTSSFTITPNTEWLILNANWDNATPNVPIQVKTPNGTFINESDFAANNIAIVDSLSSSTSKAVIVLNPTPGIWDIKVANPTGLSNVQYSAFRDSKAPTAQVTSPNTDITGQNVTINYNAVDPDSNAKVSLFYDTDNQGSDGILIANNLEEKDGNGTFTWNTEGIPTGDYYVYAMVVDDNNAPVFSYSPGKVRVTEAADLSVSKTANPDPVTVGNNLTYTIAVTNKGGNNARGVTLTDTLPEGVQLISTSINPLQQSSNQLIFELGNFNVGETKTITVTITPPTTGNITGSANVTSKTFDPDATNDIAVLTTSVDPISTDLSITTTANPTTFNLGDSLTKTFTITNNGPNKATNVNLTDYLPAGVKDVSITSNKGSLSPTNGVINVGDLNPGESVTLNITATTITADNSINAVTINSNEADSNTANNSVIQQTTVNPIAPTAADLELTQTVDNPNPNTGDLVTFNLSLSNKGPGIASSIKVTDLLPTGLSFVSATPEQGQYDPLTGIWDVGNMRDNLTRTLNITAKVENRSPIIATAQIVSVNEPDLDSTPGNNNFNEDDLAAIVLNGSPNVAVDSAFLQYLKIMGIFPPVSYR